MSGDQDEAGLVESIRAGDTLAFAQLRRQDRALVRGAIRRFVPFADENSIEDIEQEVWTAVWKSLPGFRGSSSLKTWIFGIARNTACLWLRRSKSDRETDSIPVEERPDEEDVIERVLTAISVQEAFATLSAPEQAVIRFRYFQQLTVEEVAQQAGMPLGTAKLRLRTAEEKLRYSLQETLHEKGSG